MLRTDFQGGIPFLDTATHFAFGFGLAGLAQIDPNVSGDLWTTAAITVGTVLGSQAPDADTLFRFRGNEWYIRHHRGLSHSIPAWFFWTLLISLPVWMLFPGVSLWTLMLWVFVAVVVHVFTDLFNTYGTQAIRPVSPRWIAWHIIPIFDPFLFVAHIAAIGLWISGLLKAGIIFPALYVLIALYYLWRPAARRRVMAALPRQDGDFRRGDRYTAIPTVRWSVWNVVKRREDGSYRLGTVKKGRLAWAEHYESQTSPEIERSKSHPAVAAFLSYSSHPCPRMEKRGRDTVVSWIDTRYRHRKRFPLMAVVKYNAAMEPVYGYVGWANGKKLERKLGKTSLGR